MSNADQLKKAFKDIIEQKLFIAARSRQKVLDLTYELTDWACRHAVDRNDELWDLIDALREEGKKDDL